MNVLITGGTGFIGSRLALKCLERGDTVKVLGQENNAAEAQNRQLIETEGAKVTLASVIDRDRVLGSVRGADVVYHLAAAQHEVNLPDQRFWDVNVTGTHNILEASIHAGVKRFVHGSTIGVYGSNSHGASNEHSPLTPDNIYGVTKLEAEKLVQSFSKKIPIVIIRISETYGPGDRRLLKLFKAIRKKIFFMIGSGRNLHHPIYVDDLLDGLMLAATAETARGEVFVLAGQEAMTTHEMVGVIATELGVKASKLRVPLSLVTCLAVLAETILRPIGIQPPLHRRRLDFFRKSHQFSTDGAYTSLGFVPKFDFKQGVHETAGWYSERGYL